MKCEGRFLSQRATTVLNSNIEFSVNVAVRSVNDATVVIESKMKTKKGVFFNTNTKNNTQISHVITFTVFRALETGLSHVC